MQELKELIRVSLSGRIRGVETFNQFTVSKKNLTFKLFSHISEDKIHTDEEAKELLYGKDYKGFKYNMLKERFREKLYTNLLFLQPRKRDTRAYAHNAFYCHKYYIVARLLLMVVAKKAGRSLMRKVLSRAQTYQLYEIAMLAASALRGQAIEEGNKKYFKVYAALTNNLYKIVKAENDAMEKYETMMLNFSTSYSAKPSLLSDANNTRLYIYKLKKTYNTFNLNFKFFQASSFYFSLLNDYNSTFLLCNDFEKYLIKHPKLYSPVRHANLIIMKLNCKLYLGQYKDGLALSQEYKGMYDSAEGNLLVLEELRFLLAMRAGDYLNAGIIYKSAANIIKNKNIDDRQKEMWNIFSGYLWLCLTAENEIALRDDIFINNKTFKLARLLNEVPVYSKDKEGINLSLSILQFALFIQAKDFEKAIEKAEHLKVYIYKYINKKTGARDYTMLKILSLFQSNNFEVNSLGKKANLLLNKLKSIDILNDAYARTRIEVIPYEKIWEFCLRK